MPTHTQGTSTQPFQFTGQQRDGNGLIYLRARYYDPTTGRFLSRDTLAGEFTAPSTLNRFAYALNNPVTNGDSSGLWCEEGEPTQGGAPCGAAADVGPVSVSRVNRDAYADYTKPYEVGTYRDLKNRSRPGDDLEIHHLPQKALAKRLIPDYDEDNAPAIALPQGEHRLINRMQQAAAGARNAIEDAQELVRQDIAMLQQASSAPQRAVDELKNLINQMFGI